MFPSDKLESIQNYHWMWEAKWKEEDEDDGCDWDEDTAIHEGTVKED